MAMTYASLTGPKGASGSIATWVNYSKIDLPPLVDEAQTMLYGLPMFRTREMLTSVQFTMAPGYALFPLPPRFLDPIGRLMSGTTNSPFIHKDAGYVKDNRNFTETSGILGTNPFTTTAGSNTVAVNLSQHGFNQGGMFYTTGATLFNGVTIVGTFPISSLIDANDFNIDISTLGTTPTGFGSGGGSAVNYTCDNLVSGFPVFWAIWDENIQFDAGFQQQYILRMNYYQSLPLLSSTNQTNFLTNRYPHLMRTACVTAAADFMKDDAEYQKGMARLTQLIEVGTMENDMQYRGLELDTETP